MVGEDGMGDGGRSLRKDGMGVVGEDGRHKVVGRGWKCGRGGMG